MAHGRTRRWLTGAAIIVAALALAIALGPRPEVDLTTTLPELPADLAALDDYIAASERQFDDIRPDNDKRLVWANADSPSQTDLAIVYLHGFSASRGEISPVCEQVAERLGANLFFTRLRGHGRTGDAMLDGTVNAWLNDAIEALAIGRALGRRVVLIGTSTGATLATWLAAQPEARDVHALVLVSPNYMPKNHQTQILTWPWGRYIAEAIQGPERGFETQNALHAQYWTSRYPTRVLVPMMALVDLVAELDLAAVQQPTLMIYSERDQVIDPEIARARFEAFGAPIKQRLVITDDEDPAHHLVIGDIMSPATTPAAIDTIVDFLAQL